MLGRVYTVGITISEGGAECAVTGRKVLRNPNSDEAMLLRRRTEAGQVPCTKYGEYQKTAATIIVPFRLEGWCAVLYDAWAMLGSRDITYSSRNDPNKGEGSLGPGWFVNTSC